jgi:hypothetical protein
MDIKYFPFQGPPKYTQIGSFGLRRNHLAILRWAIVFIGQFFENFRSSPHLWGTFFPRKSDV